MKLLSKGVIDAFHLGENYGIRNPVAGEVGVEVELEGIRLPRRAGNHWEVKADGSLQAPDGGVAYEYVFRQPMVRGEVQGALAELEEFLRVERAQVIPSYRQSVHVHLNAQGLTVRQLYTWLTTYLLVEDLLTEYAGPERVGNLFCLRATDAEFLVHQLAQALKNGQFFRTLANDNLRYSAVNVVALARFGSLEFRAFRGTHIAAEINEWVNALLAIKDASLRFDNPVEVIQRFSKVGPRGFLNEVVPNIAGQLARFADFERRMYTSARLVQDVAYAVDWRETVGQQPAERMGRGGFAAIAAPDVDQIARNRPPPQEAAPEAPRARRRAANPVNEIPVGRVNFAQLEQQVMAAQAAARAGRANNPWDQVVPAPVPNGLRGRVLNNINIVDDEDI